MFTVKQNKDKNVFYVTLSEKLDHTQTLAYLDLISKCSSEHITIIIDYRNAVLNESSPTPINKIADFVNTIMKNKFKHITWASIAGDYMFTTGAMILKEKVADEKIDMKAFTTFDGLLQWVNISPFELKEMTLLFKST